MIIRRMLSRIAATLFLLGSAGALSAETTATDTIGVGYGVSGKVLMIGIYGGTEFAALLFNDASDPGGPGPARIPGSR